jgi:hypothetical protein
MERKQLLLRIDPTVHDAVARWAADEFRSLNAHIRDAAAPGSGRRGPDALAKQARCPNAAGPHPQLPTSGRLSLSRDLGRLSVPRSRDDGMRTDSSAQAAAARRQASCTAERVAQSGVASSTSVPKGSRMKAHRCPCGLSAGSASGMQPAASAWV